LWGETFWEKAFSPYPSSKTFGGDFFAVVWTSLCLPPRIYLTKPTLENQLKAFVRRNFLGKSFLPVPLFKNFWRGFFCRCLDFALLAAKDLSNQTYT